MKAKHKISSLYKRAMEVDYRGLSRDLLLLICGGSFVYNLTYTWWDIVPVRAAVSAALLLIVFRGLDRRNK